MDAKMGIGASNTNEFEPPSDLIQEEDCNTLVVYLPGFTKEQLKVQLTRSRILKISGTRPLGNNRWSSFQKDFPVAENCDTNKISAKFEDGILYVRQPKLIVPDDQNKKTPETPQPHDHHKHEPHPAPKIVDQPTPTGTHHVDPNKEAPSDMGKEKIPGSENYGGNADKKADASAEKEKELIPGSQKYGGIYADKKVDASAEKEKELIPGSQKNGGIYADKKVDASAEKEKIPGSEKNGGIYADKKADASAEKEKELIPGSEKYGGIYADKKVDASAEKEKIPGSEKYGGIYTDKKVDAATTSGGDDKSRDQNAAGRKLDVAAKLDGYINKVKQETELKRAREKMTKILLLLFVFTLGMFVSKLPWFARKNEN